MLERSDLFFSNRVKEQELKNKGCETELPTRKSNHLHFFLSYLKTLSVVPGGDYNPGPPARKSSALSNAPTGGRCEI